MLRIYLKCLGSFRKIYSDASSRLEKLTFSGNYYRKDIGRVEFVRFHAPILGGFLLLTYGVWCVKKADRRRKLVLPGFMQLKDELPFLMRMKIEYFQSDPEKASVLNIDGWLEEKSLSEKLQAFLLQMKSIQLFNSKEYRKAKECLSSALQICEKLKKNSEDMLVLNLTFYMSLLTISEDNIELGLNGLLFCASRVCALRKSKAWEALETCEQYSFNRLALKFIAKYLRVAANVSSSADENKKKFPQFVHEALEIYGELSRDFYDSGGSFLSLTDELDSDLQLVEIINDFLFLQLESLNEGQKPENLEVYLAHAKRLESEMKTAEMRKELMFSKFIEAYYKERMEKYEEALREYNILIHSIRDKTVLKLVKYRKNCLLNKIENLEK